MMLYKPLMFVLAASLAEPAYATTIIDFSDQSLGFYATITYPEATFTPISNGASLLISGSYTSDREICGYGDFFCDQGFTVTFTNPVNNLNFTSDGDTNEGNDISVQVNTLLGSFAFAGNSDGIPIYSDLQDLSAYADITSIVISTSELGGLHYDNFTFDTLAPVPEPSTWAMMLLGFGAVGFAMRRRKRAVGSQGDLSRRLLIS